MENEFSVGIIDNTNICGNLQVIRWTIVEGVRFRHTGPQQVFNCPIGHPPPNLPLSGSKNLKSGQNTEKRSNFILNQFS